MKPMLLATLLLSIAVVAAEQNSSPSQTRTAVFAGGCFWCIQPAFDKASGVIKTIVGYRRWNRTEPDIQARYLGEDKVSRINRSHLRPGEDFLRAASRHLLAANRSHPIRRPVHRYRTELSRCDLLWQPRGKENCRGFKRQTRALWKIQKADCDGSSAGDEVLAGGRLSPEILPGEPRAFRSFRRRLGRVSFKKDKWGGEQ